MPYNEILLAIHSFLMLVVTSMIAGFMIKQKSSAHPSGSGEDSRREAV